MMCVLQPAKTAELRQPGIFAHAVKTGGIYIYIYTYPVGWEWSSLFSKGILIQVGEKATNYKVDER